VRQIVTVTGDTASVVLERLPRAYGVEIRDVLLTALLRTITSWTGGTRLVVELENHGRGRAFGALDVSRTIGRFSTLSPALLCRSDGADPCAELISVRDQLSAVPHQGVGYGLLRYLHPDPGVRAALARVPAPEIGFNFWGNVSEYFTGDSRPVPDSFGDHRSGIGHRSRVLDLMALAAEGELQLVWTYSTNLHTESTVRVLAERFIEELQRLAELCDGAR
jgi:non-ribosomal peptide synthase protein (TIGR01720 family)